MLSAVNVLAGVGFLVMGICGTAGAIALFVTRRSWSERLLHSWLEGGANAKGINRPLYFHFRCPKWDDERYRRRQLTGTWVPAVFGCVVVAFAGFVAAAAHF